MRVTILATSLAFLFGCGTNEMPNSKQMHELTSQEINDSLNHVEAISDTTQEVSQGFSIDFSKKFESENIGIKLSYPRKFKVDSNLNYYLPVTLINTTDATVIGLSLRRRESSSIGHYDLGKYKLKITSHDSILLKLSLRTMKLDEEYIEKPWAIGPIEANEVFYADGTYASDKITYKVN